MAGYFQNVRSQWFGSNRRPRIESRYIITTTCYLVARSRIKTNFLRSEFVAFSQMGFNFSPNFTQQLTSRSTDRKEVSVDEFIVLCVSIQRLTEAFRVRDTQQNGVISIGFEDFLSVVLTNTN